MQSTPSSLLTHGLTLGDEVDYLSFSSYWCPARVESVSEGGALLRIRFAAGDADVTHALDVRHAGDARRLAPFCA